MNYLQPNPYGLDYWVQQAQTRLYNLYLKPVLGLTDTNCLSFGRTYRNNVSDSGKTGYIPEAFINGQYISSSGASNRGGLFFESGKFIIFWGEVSNKKQTNAQYIANMELIVFADMSIITPGSISTSNQRLDEVLLSQLESFITFNGCGWQVKQTTFDIDKVLERYSGSQKRNALTRNLSDGGNQSSFCALKLICELCYDPGQVQTKQLQTLQPMDISIVLYIKTVPKPANTIYVGNGRYIYAEYGEANTLTPLYTDTNLPFLKGKNVQVPFVYNDTNITLPNYNIGTGIWTLAGVPQGFNDGDYIALNLTNYV